jgi:hypothetical protein
MGPDDLLGFDFLVRHRNVAPNKWANPESTFGVPVSRSRQTTGRSAIYIPKPKRNQCAAWNTRTAYQSTSSTTR